MGMTEFTMILGAIGALGSCASDDRIEIADAGPRVQVERTVDGFDKIEVAGPIRVTVSEGAPSALSISGPENVMEYLETTTASGKLRIGIRKGVKTAWRWNDDNAVTVALSHNALRAGAIAGSGSLDIASVKGESFDGDIGGSGNLNVGSLDVATAEFSIAGSGDVSAKGRTTELDVDIAGSGEYMGAELESENADISIAGSGDVEARATRTADVSIAGSGDVAITGGAKCSVSKAGSGNVTCE